MREIFSDPQIESYKIPINARSYMIIPGGIRGYKSHKLEYGSRTNEAEEIISSSKSISPEPLKTIDSDNDCTILTNNTTAHRISQSLEQKGYMSNHFYETTLRDLGFPGNSEIPINVLRRIQKNIIGQPKGAAINMLRAEKSRLNILRQKLQNFAENAWEDPL